MINSCNFNKLLFAKLQLEKLKKIFNLKLQK